MTPKTYFLHTKEFGTETTANESGLMFSVINDYKHLYVLKFRNQPFGMGIVILKYVRLEN